MMGCGIWRHINEPQKKCTWAKKGYCAISVFVSMCDSMNTIPLWLCWINSTDAKIKIKIKSRDNTLPTKVHLVKAMVFPLVIYGCESWATKKAECWRIDAFELWCWRRLLRVPWTARQSNQSILKEISPEYFQSWIFTGKIDAEADIPILWPPAVKNWLIGKDPDVGKDWRQEEKGTTEGEMVRWHHQLDRHESEQAPGVGDGQGNLVSIGWQRVEHDWAIELNWPNLTVTIMRNRNRSCVIHLDRILPINFLMCQVQAMNVDVMDWFCQLKKK